MRDSKSLVIVLDRLISHGLSPSSALDVLRRAATRHGVSVGVLTTRIVAGA